MKTPDINEIIKQRLKPFLTTDWSILPSEDLDDQAQQINKKKKLEVTHANALLWFAKGPHNSIFFLKDYSLDSKIPERVIFPTEYLGVLVIHVYERCILSACWRGYEFIMMDEIKTSFGPHPISQIEIDFCFKITQALSLD